MGDFIDGGISYTFFELLTHNVYKEASLMERVTGKEKNCRNGNAAYFLFFFFFFYY